MTARITADWLHEPALQAVFDALETDGDTARVVGGAVRNTLFHRSLFASAPQRRSAPQVFSRRYMPARRTRGARSSATR